MFAYPVTCVIHDIPRQLMWKSEMAGQYRESLLTLTEGVRWGVWGEVVCCSRVIGTDDDGPDGGELGEGPFGDETAVVGEGEVEEWDVASRRGRQSVVRGQATGGRV